MEIKICKLAYFLVVHNSKTTGYILEAFYLATLIGRRALQVFLTSSSKCNVLSTLLETKTEFYAPVMAEIENKHLD